MMNSVKFSSVDRVTYSCLLSFTIDPFVNEISSFDNNLRTYNDLIYVKENAIACMLHWTLAEEREKEIDLAYLSTRSP